MKYMEGAMDKGVNILGIAGSLRRESYNKALLRASLNLVPETSSLTICEIDKIPLFNQDLENSLPDTVKEFKNKLKAADAILFVTPEYNYSIPGVLKNAIDWASRPYGDNSLEGKPVALMSASIGMLGGARAQYHLRQSLVFLNMHPINRPEIMVPFAPQKFDDKGNLLDDKTRQLIRDLLQNLVAWTQKLSTV
jgi:chromate reductase, NAD(P)H dehydrogenase (quinone)